MTLSKKLPVLLFSLLLLSTLGFSLNLAAASSRTITVPTDYPSIQDAINSAVDGDIIYILKGYYVENPIVNKSISLVGEDRDTTVIDVTAGLKVLSNSVVITGLTIFDGGYHGITLSANSCRITGNKITDSEHGIVLISAYGNDVSENMLYSIGLAAAIELSYSNNNTVRYNRINSCTEGIHLLGSSNNTVVDNLVSDCQDIAIRLLGSGVGKQWYGPDGNTIMRNNVTDSRVGTHVYGSNNNLISNNNYVNNTIQFSANEDYYLTFGGNRSVNTISGNYWSDYNGTDGNSDGVGDTPYVIDAYNQDDQPLMRPVDVLPPPFQSTRPQVSATPTPSPSAPVETNSGISYVAALEVVSVVVAVVAGSLMRIRKRTHRP